MSVQRSVIFQAITPKSRKDWLKYLVDEFFTDIKTEPKEVRMVKRVLRNEFRRFRFKNGKWRIDYVKKGNSIMIHKFKEKPTEDYLRRLQEQSKTQHVQKCLDRLKEHAANIKAGAPRQPARLAIMQPEPECKHCGGNEWVKNQRLVCAKCGLEGRAIHPAGYDHRNMRREEGHNPSQNNGFVRNHDLSDAANSATMVRRAPANARASDKTASKRDFQRLQAANRCLNAQTKTDSQLIGAEKKIQDAVHSMQLNENFARRAYALFKAFINNNDKLPREDETIAACIFNVMPTLHASSAFSAGASSASSASSASAGASAGASSAGASAGASSASSAGASRKRPRCETPEYLLLKKLTEKFQAEETKKKKRRNSL